MFHVITSRCDLVKVVMITDNYLLHSNMRNVMMVPIINQYASTKVMVLSQLEINANSYSLGLSELPRCTVVAM